MTTMDVVVFVPLVPAMPVLATWWLPWERWLPKYVPNIKVMDKKEEASGNHP